MRIYDLDVTIFAAGLPFDGSTIPSGQSLGGSETAAVQMAEEMTRQGHHVVVFSNCAEAKHVNKVHYLPIGWVQAVGGGNFPKGFFDYVRSVPSDLLIVQRMPVMFQFDTRAKAHLLWQHDLATRTGPSQFHPFMWNTDRILVLSEFMKRQYLQVHGGPPDMFHVTRNGVDLDLIDSVPEQQRDRFRLTYTARPERGLDVLIREVFPRILNREPRAKLHISRYQDPATLDLYNQLETEMKRFGDRIEFMGNLGKKALYENYRKSRAYVYPSMFEEISCLTSVEVAACGSVFLGPWRAALPETIGGCAPLIHDDGTLGQTGDPAETGFKPPTQRFIEGMVDQAVRLMHDDAYWQSWQRKGVERARSLTWEAVAKDWIGLAHELIGKRSADGKRLVKHFLVNSDVVGARRYAEKVGDEQLKKSVDKYVKTNVPFLDSKDDDVRRHKIAEFYEERSGGDGADWRTGFWADQELRLRILLEFLKPKVEAGEIKTLLDFGCAHGGYARVLSNTFPDLKIVGVDNSRSLIRCANEMKTGQLDDGSPACKHPENLSFIVGDEDSDIYKPSSEISFATFGYVPKEQCLYNNGEEGIKLQGEPAQFDCVVAMELLEHLPDSEHVAKKLEHHCKPGGWMVFTVPHGHRERDEYVTKGVPPVHVRSFDLHDLREIFGKRQDYSVNCFSDLQELALDHTFSGWFMVTYKNDEKPLGEIDWDRKFFLQGPRETLAVCMIANNSEAVMHRCLRSVQRFADQMIVVDNGPSEDRTAEVAGEYTPDVRSGTSPFWCYSHAVRHAPDQIIPGTCDMAGFETPRNESVEGVWADWVLWIDCDEQLLDGARIQKYLRPNHYIGYAMQQHHISIDPPNAVRKDIPIRLYRNVAGMRCFGKVHEHFELGINRGAGGAQMIVPDVHIHHDGYLVESIRRGRFARNFKLLQCDRLKYPDRLLGIFLYEIRDHMHLAHYELERNGKRLTPEVQKHCETCVEAFRKHFLGLNYLFNEDGLRYYSEALSILGVGVEVAVAVDVKQIGANPGEVFKFRAADLDEAKRIIAARVDAVGQGQTGPYYA